MDIYRSASRLTLDDVTLLLMDINPSKATAMVNYNDKQSNAPVK